MERQKNKSAMALGADERKEIRKIIVPDPRSKSRDKLQNLDIFDSTAKLVLTDNNNAHASQAHTVSEEDEI